MRETIGAIGYPTSCPSCEMVRAGLARVLESILSARDFEVDEAGSVRYKYQRLKPFGGFA
ncbi:hypothetical protein [Nitrospira sp. M1]